MSTQLNRGGVKYKFAAGVRENRSLINYNSVYHACNEYLKNCHLDTTDEYINTEKEESDDDNTDEY